MPTQSKRRGRQTTLSFNPLLSSSPHAADLSSSVRGRAAAVTFDGSPQPKRRRVGSQNPHEEEQHKVPLPTPAKSSQPSRKTRASAKQQRQGKLDFSFHCTVDKPEESAFEESTIAPTPPKTRPRAGIFGKGPRSSDLDDSSESDDAEEEDERSSTAPARKTRRTRNVPDASDSESEGPMRVTRAAASQRQSARRVTRQSLSRRATAISSGEEEEPGTSDDPIQYPNNPNNYASIPPKYDDIAEPETSGDDIMQSSPTIKSRRRASKPKPRDDFINDDESDESIVTPIRRRQPKVSDDTNTQSQEDDDEEDEEENISSGRRRSINKRTQEDLEEDLEFLRSSPPSERKSRVNPKQAARQKALELLRQRRASNRSGPPGEDAASKNPSDSELEIIDGPDIISDDSESHAQIEDELDPEDQRTSYRAMFQAEDEDEDFIVEDPEEEDQAPLADLQIPLHLTSYGRMKPKDLFKYVVEWMVQKKVNPAFRMEDEIYKLAFRKLDDEVQGLSGSKFTSSVWRQDFTLALRARPKIIAQQLTSGDWVGGCEACGRQSHPASFLVQFEGKPYRMDTLENVSDDDDSDEDNEDDESLDADGRQIPNQDRKWYVGVHCKTNAETGHTLHHWRYHLNEWIIDWLLSEGYLSKEKVFERDSWSTKKKRKYANTIVDSMHEKGEIKALYLDFRNNVDSARDAKQYQHSRRR